LDFILKLTNINSIINEKNLNKNLILKFILRLQFYILANSIEMHLKKNLEKIASPLLRKNL